MWKHKNFINLQLCAGETWVLNETIALPSGNMSAEFQSNNQYFATIGTGIMYSKNYLSYINEDNDDTFVYRENTNTWVNEDGTDTTAYRTIVFDVPVTDTTLLTWLQANATKQSTPQPTFTFKHFYDAGTIGSGTYKFRHYSQTEPLPQLATPQNVSASGTIVSWGAVENATSYEILVGGSSFGTVSTTSVDLSTLSGWVSLTDGTYNITIVAKAGGYRDSEPSAAVSVTKSSVKFVQIFPTTTSDNYTLFDNLNQSKVYTTLIKDYPYVKTLKYSGGEWHASGITIISQTSNSVKAIVINQGDMYFTSYYEGKTLEGNEEATITDFDGFDWHAVYANWACLVEGTKITLSDGSTKPVQDIQYEDKVLCYDFTSGVQTTSYIDWMIPERIATRYWEITLSDGTILNLVGSNGKSHRLYNVTKQRFDYPQDFEPNDLTLKEDGTTARVVSCKQIEKTVKFYNIASHEHINVYANGVLTSNRLNNRFKIVDNKFTDEKVMTDKEVADYIDHLNSIRAK